MDATHRRERRAAQRRERKAAWFRDGQTALRIAAPDAGPVYRCPLCLRDFACPEDLTFDHVPPRSAGGRPLVLTCRECNSVSGHTVDAALAQRLDVEAFVAGNLAARARCTWGGHTVNGEFKVGADDYSLLISDRNHPERSAALRRQLEQWTASGTIPDAIDLSFWLPRADPEMERVAWIKAGYLAAFASLGYRYILDPALDPVRRQIANPKTDVFGYGVMTLDDKAEEPQIVWVREPGVLRGFLVRFGLKGVSLPAQGNRSFYPEVNEYAKNRNGRCRFHGLTFALPKRPTFALDFSPPGRYFRQ